MSFNRFLSEEDFDRLSNADRTDALFRVAVLPDQSADGKAILAQVRIAELAAEKENFPLPQPITARREHALQLTSFAQSAIEGTIRLDQPSLLILQIPFDRGWRAFSDGKAVPAVKADIGLLGVFLERGEHRITLRYRNPCFLFGLGCSLVGLLLFAWGLWRWPRLGLPNESS